MRKRELWSCGGYAMPDALAGLAILGMLAIGVLTLLHVSVHMMQEAERLDRAREAAESVVARLEGVSWVRMPEFFGGDDSDSRAELDTEDGSAPADWRALIDGLPGGRIRVSLEGLGAGGVSVSFRDATALRVRAEVLFDGGPRGRVVELSALRY